MISTVAFRVGNTWTEITYGDEFIRNVLKKESSYPTQAAELLKCPPRTDSEKGDGDGWDGWVRLMRTPKTKFWYFPTGLVPRLSRISEKYGYSVYIEDNRQRPMEGIPEHSQEGEIVDRDYQLEAADKAYALGRGVLDMPPRAGKTRTMVEIHRRFGLTTLWIAPTNRIVDQTVSVVQRFLGKNYAVNLETSKDASAAAGARVVVCTAALAANLPESFYQTRELLVVDEWHHGAAKTYTSGIFPKCDHIFFRFGMTGTHFRSGNDDLAMHGLLSTVIYKVTTRFLLNRGYLVPAHAVFLPMPAYPKLRGVSGTFNTGHGKHGIHLHQARNQLATHAAFYLSRAQRKVLILVGTKVQGYAIQKMLSAFFPEADHGYEFRPVEFISTDVWRPKQKRVLESFLDDQEVKVLIGTSLLGEGVDLPGVNALVYARGEKAEVTLRQNWFRVCTAIPGKTNAVIVDFADRHNAKLLKHSHNRLDAYYSEPIFTTSILQDSRQFVPWLNQLS